MVMTATDHYGKASLAVILMNELGCQFMILRYITGHRRNISGVDYGLLYCARPIEESKHLAERMRATCGTEPSMDVINTLMIWNAY
jgi:hypothetical protein